MIQYFLLNKLILNEIKELGGTTENFLEIDPSLVSGKLIGSDIARMI